MSTVLDEPSAVEVGSHWVDFLGFKVDFGPRLEMTEDEFVDFCMRNKDLRIERTKEGDILIMPPTFGKTGKYNFRLAIQFGNWMIRDGTGEAYDSSTAFTLPNGAVRSPDLSWILTERWNALSASAQNKFPSICPDFVIELRSETDRLPVVKSKMEEYIENGAQLGWLLDPIDRRVYVYRPDQEVEILDDPQTVSGEPELKGFILELAAIWD